jgi:DNA-binding MarR family transcriptional regulator
MAVLAIPVSWAVWTSRLLPRPALGILGFSAMSLVAILTRMPPDTPQSPNAVPRRRFQFRLWMIFVVITAVAVVLAAVRAFGIEVMGAALSVLQCVAIVFGFLYAAWAVLVYLGRSPGTHPRRLPSNETELQIMIQIGRTNRKKVTVHEVTELLHISDIQAQHFLDKLTRFGFLEKDEIPGSSRPTWYSLTPEGRRLLAEQGLT